MSTPKDHDGPLMKTRVFISEARFTPKALIVN